MKKRHFYAVIFLPPFLLSGIQRYDGQSFCFLYTEGSKQKRRGCPTTDGNRLSFYLMRRCYVTP